MNDTSKGPILVPHAEVQWPFSSWLLSDQVLVLPPLFDQQVCLLRPLLSHPRLVALSSLPGLRPSVVVRVHQSGH